MQHRLKRDAEGRPLHLGPVVTNAYQAAKLLASPVGVRSGGGVWRPVPHGPSRVIGWYEVSRGSVNSAWVAPRDVFRAAMLTNAASLILARQSSVGRIASER